jgi:hypothetical protein
MNELSKLSGASPVSPTTSRIWKPPRKQKPGDRPPGKKHERLRKEDEEGRGAPGEREERKALEIEEIEPSQGDVERLGYGSGVLRRKRNHRIDLII